MKLINKILRVFWDIMLTEIIPLKRRYDFEAQEEAIKKLELEIEKRKRIK